MPTAASLMTVAEVAELLQLAPRTVRQQLDAGLLDGRKVGRDWLVNPASVDAYRRDHLGKRKRRTPSAG